MKKNGNRKKSRRVIKQRWKDNIMNRDKVFDFLGGIIVGAAFISAIFFFHTMKKLQGQQVVAPVKIMWPESTLVEPELHYYNIPDTLPEISVINYNEDNRKCLALNIYFEARNQLVKGQFGVAYVTLNRVYDKKFPNTICKVVKQGRYHSSGEPKRNECQFSFYCDGKPDIPKDISAWENAITIANHALNNYSKNYQDVTHGATFYHATYVRPDWSRFNLEHSITIGNHIFYRTKNE